MHHIYNIFNMIGTILFAILDGVIFVVTLPVKLIIDII